MFCGSLVGLLIPLVLVFVVAIVLVSLLGTVGILLGLLWPTVPILIGLALIWRILAGRRR
jgi:hypothetical protein